jgi:CHAD domain-containing protein
MLTEHIIIESAALELAKRLPSLEKHNYNTIDQLMRQIASKHRITGKALHDLFIKKFHKNPDNWIKDKLDEANDEPDFLADNPIMQKFIDWASSELHLKSTPDFEFSYDTDEAQEGHHTGRHSTNDNSVWVYVANRNMVDIMRTVYHELTHVRQGELNMIKPGDSYPGSPIEMLADMTAGKAMKIFGKDHPEIFQYKSML